MFRTIFLLIVFVSLTQCTRQNDFQKAGTLITNEYEKGNFSAAAELIRKSQSKKDITEEFRSWLTIRQARIERIRLDFSKTEEQIKAQLAKYYPALPDSLMASWENSGRLEMRLIDGEKRYFNNAVLNLFRLDSAAARVYQTKKVFSNGPLDSIRMVNSSSIIGADKPGAPVESLRISIRYTLTVDADAVPAGEKINCWLPFPRLSKPRQTNIVLHSSIPVMVKKSNPECLHSSLFATKEAIAGTPTVFSYTASYDIAGQWFKSEDILTGQVRRSPVDLGKYLSEEPPHISFTPLVRQLADSLADGESQPFKIIRSFFYWIDRNIPWASALEYSTFECIPDYVINQRHGDCGMKTFLLLSMARYKGIPARWQSGWMLHPGEENLHDWGELWFDATGWVPFDISFGLQKTNNLSLQEFYLTGIDSYRMIVNDGIANNFDPLKKFYRSEPFDFQRGEVEWSGGNLYFNQWDYHLHVLSIQKINQ